MTSSIDNFFRQQAVEVDAFVDELAQPGNPLAVLNDNPTQTSYSVSKVSAACILFFEDSWATETGRSGFTYNVTAFPKTKINRERFILSLAPLDTQITNVLQEMVKEASSCVGIDPLIYRLLTTSNEADLIEIITQLIEDHIDFASLSESELESSLQKFLTSAISENPGLLRHALMHQGHNRISQRLIREMAAGHIEDLQKEKDRVSRIKEILKAQLMDHQKDAKAISLRHLESLAGKTEVQRTFNVDQLQYTLVLDNGINQQKFIYQVKV